MTDFTIASFNVKNLIGPEREYYRFQKYTVEEHAWKQDWLAEMLVTMNADIVCFQEIFEEDALKSVVAVSVFIKENFRRKFLVPLEWIVRPLKENLDFCSPL